MRIGILTFHRAYNCGAMLQAWALQTVLERMGHQVSFPACNSVGYGEIKHYVQRIPKEKKGLSWVRSLVGRACLDIRHFREYPWELVGYNRFRRQYLNEVELGPRDFSSHYDRIVVGSDQVWSDIHSLNDAPLFFGENVDCKLLHIAYAASYGDKPLEGERLSRVLSSLKRYSAISVREQLVKDQIETSYDKPVEVVVDPSLLLTANDYAKLKRRNVSGRYLYCYCLEATRYIVDTVKATSAMLGLKPIITSVYKTKRCVDDKIVDYFVSPAKMVALTRGSVCTMPASFHGTALSLIHNKPFVSLREQVDQYESRPASLLRQVGELRRLVNPATDQNVILESLKTTPSADAIVKIEHLRNKSFEWLKGALS